MESSSRMRRFLRRNYDGSDHICAAANSVGRFDSEHDQVHVTSPSKMSLLSAQAITMNVVDEDDEQGNTVNLEGKEGVENQDEMVVRPSETAEQPSQVPGQSVELQLTSEQEFVETPSAVSPRYVPSEHDERILFDLPATMVRPLRVTRGMFQVSAYF